MKRDRVDVLMGLVVAMLVLGCIAIAAWIGVALGWVR